MPAHATIMTGLYPYNHAVRNNGTYILGQDHTTLAEQLKKSGYVTHAIVSSFVLDSQFGLDQGFDTYDDDLSGGPQQKMFMFREIRASQTANKAVAWLEQTRPKDKPFFLWLHFYDPHADYEPPVEIADRLPGERYEGEIAYADRELGRVLQALEKSGVARDTLIAFASDHGESLGEHGERSHGIFIYNSTIRVPMFFAGKGVPEGKRVDSLARTADIAPTILSFLGLDPPDKLDGSSLLNVMKGKGEPARTAYAESMSPQLNFGWAPLRTLLTEKTKFIDAPKPEVYDLRRDQRELTNLYSPDVVSPEARPLIANLRAIQGNDPFTRGQHTEATLDPETRRKLAALGYVWGNQKAPEGPRADPKDRIVYWERFQEAQSAIRRHEYPQALAMVRSVLEVDHDNVVAMASLANVLTRMSARDQALDVYKRMIAVDPTRDTPYLGASRILRELGRFKEAEDHARTVIGIQPENPEGYTAVGDVMLDQNRFAEAESMFRQALRIDPHSGAAISGLGNCLNRAGRMREALAVLRDGRKQDPSSQAIVYNLAVVVERQGDTAGAKKLYEESLKIDPEHSMTWNNLGALLDRAGQRDEAIRCVTRARQTDPSNAEAAYNLGVLLMASGKPAEAVPHLNDVLRIRPSFLPGAIQRARALTLAGDLETAIKAWSQLTPVAPVAWLHIARIELDRGREKDARVALGRGLESGGEKIREIAGQDSRLRPLLGTPGPARSRS